MSRQHAGGMQPCVAARAWEAWEAGAWGSCDRWQRHARVPGGPEGQDSVTSRGPGVTCCGRAGPCQLLLAGMAAGM